MCSHTCFPIHVTYPLYGPMICLECSHMTSTNQSQSDVKFVTEDKGVVGGGTEQLWFNALMPNIMVH